MRPLNARYVLIVLSLSILQACGEGIPVPEAPLVRPTKLFEVEGGDTTQTVVLPAVVEASDSTVMTFQVPGLLQTLDIVEGGEVAAGSVLGQLDLREFNNAVAAAEAEYTRAKSEYERARSLLEADAIAKSAVEQRRAAFQSADAALSNARKRRDDATLRAPFDAVVVDLHVEKFQTVAPGQPVVTLQTDGLTEAVIQVPASIVIKPDNAEPRNVFLMLDAAAGSRIPAEFSEVVAQADPATQTFEVRFRFTPPADMVVLPGMTGTLTAELPESNESTRATPYVPLTAVLSEGEDTFVWLVDTNAMSVTKRPVVVGDPRGDSVAIDDGLSPGDVIVAAGGNYLYEGAQIRAF